MNNDELSQQALRGKWRIWIIGFAIWTIVGLSFASRYFLTFYKRGDDVTWQQVYFGNLIDFYLWGLTTPFIFWLSRSYPIERKHLVSRSMLHLVVAMLLNVIVLSIASPIIWYSGLENKALYPTPFSYIIPSILEPPLLHQALLVYCGTLIVAHAFEYYRQFQEGKARAVELASQLAQAQLSALKMQIQPHFLFNTLNSIAALLHKDVEAADRMIARLSDFLRMTLKSSGESAVTLEQELEFVKTYLEIEKIRFQDSLQVEFHISEDALEAQVPNLILQPLIENAVRHGAARQISVGRLQIHAAREADRLLIKIEDNGPGLDGNVNRKSKAGVGIGLANTRARLGQFYGDDFSFEIAGTPDSSGTVVSLNVPCLV